MSLFDVDLNPGRRPLRVFGLASAALLAGAAVAMWDHPASATLAVAASAVGAVALLWPVALRYLYVGLSLVTWPVGWAVSWIVLAALFYGIVTPIGLLLRLAGRDALGRRFDPSAASYRTPRPPAPEPRRYFRQY
jgi:hypothetical protein